MVTLFIIRGLPGTGKSTLGRTLAPEMSFAADDYFTDEEGNYNFDPSKLREAHAQCTRNVRNAVETGLRMVDELGDVRVAVCNTFSRRWEYAPYTQMARTLGIRYYVIDLFDNDTPIDTLFERNLHGVPRDIIKAMYDRWER